MLHLRLPLVLAIINTFCCCNKDTTDNPESPSENAPLLQKVVVTNYDNASHTDEYTYDSERRPVKIVFSSNQYTWKNVVDIEYHSNSQLRTATFRTVNDSSSLVQNILSYTYIYNNNKIVKRMTTVLDPNGGGQDGHAYSYDAQGRLIADTIFDGHTLKAEGYTKYLWDEHNNVIRNESYASDNNGIFVLATYWEYKYDNMKNPYINLPVYFINDYVGFYLSENTITGFQQEGDSMDTYQNQYTSTGLLSKTEYRSSANPVLFATYEYFYN